MSFVISFLLAIATYAASHEAAHAGLKFLFRLASTVFLARTTYIAVRPFCRAIGRLVPGGARANAVWFPEHPDAPPIEVRISRQLIRIPSSLAKAVYRAGKWLFEK